MSELSLLPEEKKKLPRKESLESVYSSNSRLNLLNKRARAPAAMMAPGKGDRFVAQRVLSAKSHRVKQLQNQLADAHYHLQELSNENKMLRGIQKKQEIALQRYENSNAELPTVLNSHSEEIRIQSMKYKQLKQQFKEVSQKLKERDMQYQQLKDEHDHLVELTKDRNLQEREKLQFQVSELTTKVQTQAETISQLQRRLVLEAKNFRHQLQTEINKHKDTRHDLDLAISNADKLSTIIEIKEKMINTAAIRNAKSPPKGPGGGGAGGGGGGGGPRPPPRKAAEHAAPHSAHTARGAGDERARSGDRYERSSVDVVTNTHIAKLYENSRYLNSSLSHDEDTSSSNDPRSRYMRSRASSVSTRSHTPNQTRKSSKGSDEISDLAKTVQDGMADLSIFEEMETNEAPDEMQKKIDYMKADLMNKIKSDMDVPIKEENIVKESMEPISRKASFIRRQSNEESIEEQIVEEFDRPKSVKGRRSSSVTFSYGTNVTNITSEPDENSTISITTNSNDPRSGRGDELDRYKLKRDSASDKRVVINKPIDKYCNDIIHDIERSTKVIDKHMKQFSYTKMEGDKLVEQLQMVDKLNDLVTNGEIPSGTLEELNNNFKILSENVLSDAPVARKRSVSSRRGSSKLKNDVLGDMSMSNQELLNDLLGRN